MAVSNKKLWKLLIDKDVKALDCGVEDIMGVAPDDKRC